MRSRFNLPLLLTALLLGGCAGTAPTPVTIGSSTTLLVQGAEIALEKNTALLGKFQNACVIAGNFLVAQAANITAASLQSLLTAELNKHGIDTVTVTAVVKIAQAELNVLLSQYNFTAIQNDAAKVAALYARIQPYIIEVGKALQGAGPGPANV